MKPRYQITNQLMFHGDVFVNRNTRHVKSDIIIYDGKPDKSTTLKTIYFYPQFMKISEAPRSFSASKDSVDDEALINQRNETNIWM